MNYEKAIEQMQRELVVKGMHFETMFPNRETVDIYDWQLDFEENIDFALWELEMREKNGER